MNHEKEELIAEILGRVAAQRQVTAPATPQPVPSDSRALQYIPTNLVAPGMGDVLGFDIRRLLGDALPTVPKVDEFFHLLGVVSDEVLRTDSELCSVQERLLSQLAALLHTLDGLIRQGCPDDLYRGVVYTIDQLWIQFGEAMVSRRVAIARASKWPSYLVELCRSSASEPGQLFGSELLQKYMVMRSLRADEPPRQPGNRKGNSRDASTPRRRNPKRAPSQPAHPTGDTQPTPSTTNRPPK